MKHTLSCFLFSMIALLTLQACSDADYSGKYTDPSKTNTASCEKLMTGAFYAGKQYTFNSYMRIYVWDYLAISKFTQTLGFVNAEGRYENSIIYYEDRWKSFYNVLAQYRALENAYNLLPNEDKTDYEVFVWLTQIFTYDHLTQVMQCWGDVPFNKAGYLPVTDNVATSYAAYDDDVELFTNVLEELKNINTKLSNLNSISDRTSGYLPAQDFINKGDLKLWRKYCNSLRLRIAMLLADQGDLTTLGRATIKEMLENEATYPMVNDNSENIQAIPDSDGFDYENDYKNGWETSVYTNRASQAMIDALQGDARMPVFFDVNAKGEYIGIDTHDDYSKQDNLINKSNKEHYYCAYDSATFSRNKKLPGNIITSAEVSFLKAEAYQKGYASGDARAAFIKGMLLSTEMYYKINALSTFRPPLTASSATDVETFAKAKWDAAGNKEEAICTQEWLNFSFLQTTQAWSLIRRTGYPALYFQTDATAAEVKNVPNRLKYPPSETNSNKTNFNKVSSQNNYTDKLFWAK